MFANHNNNIEKSKNHRDSLFDFCHINNHLDFPCRTLAAPICFGYSQCENVVEFYNLWNNWNIYSDNNILPDFFKKGKQQDKDGKN